MLEKLNVLINNKKEMTGIAFASISVVGFSLFYIIPFILSFYYIFTKDMFNKKFVGFNNFILLFKNLAFRNALFNTLLLTFLSVSLIMLISFCISVIIHYNAKNTNIIKGILILPMFIPTAVGTVFWKILFQDNGIINSILFNITGREIQFLSSVHTVFVVVIMYLWKNIGFNIVLLTSGLQRVPKAAIEAAEIDGAGFWSIMKKIVLPLMIPIILFTLIMSITNSFKIFKEVFLMTGDYPDKHVYLLQHFMNNQFKNFNFQMLSASAFVVVAIITIVVSVIFKIEKKISEGLY